MRTTLRYLTPLAAAAGAAAAILAAVLGAAALTPSAPPPGNVEINSTPAQQEFVGPWGNMWDETGLFFP